MTTPICYANYLEASEGKISYSMEKTEIEVKKRTVNGIYEKKMSVTKSMPLVGTLAESLMTAAQTIK